MSTTPPPNDPSEDPTQVSAGDPLGDASATPSPPPPPPPPGDGPRRLTRSRGDRVLAGVCGGVAEYFRIDPVIARIVAVVLVFFGGAGALLYLAAVLLVPNEGEAGGVAPDDRNRWLVVLGAVALVCVIGPLVIGSAFVVGGLIFPLAFVVVVALVAAWLVTGRWPEREAGPIARAIAVGIGILTILTLVATGAFWGAAVGGDEVVAGLVIAAGAAVLAGAFVKPVRWLIPLALAVAIPAGFVAAAGIELDGGIGEKRYTPGTTAEIRDRYEIGIGELVVDLRGAELGAGDREIDIDVGMGHALLLVDEGVCVATRARVGAGQVDVFDTGNGGVDVDVDDMPRADGDAPRIVIDGDVGLGYLEVAHKELPDESWDDRSLDRGENTGCVGA